MGTVIGKLHGSTPVSSTQARPLGATLSPAKLSDIARIFNLVQLGSLNGHFSNLYTQPRYMAGLGMQLFSLWGRGSIKLPDGTRHPAHMKTLRVGGDFAGFVILRHEAHPPNAVEIYMCGLEANARGKGLGEWMLRTALAKLPTGQVLFAECLPNSIQMKALLKKLGFKETHLAPSPGLPQVAQRYVYTGAG